MLIEHGNGKHTAWKVESTWPCPTTAEEPQPKLPKVLQAGLNTARPARESGDTVIILQERKLDKSTLIALS